MAVAPPLPPFQLISPAVFFLNLYCCSEAICYILLLLLSLESSEQQFQLQSLARIGWSREQSSWKIKKKIRSLACIGFPTAANLKIRERGRWRGLVVVLLCICFSKKKRNRNILVISVVIFLFLSLCFFSASRAIIFLED